ncbi:multidrug resistance protein MdtO [Terriglobus roseus]|uniref:Multidrug resistance protein MdtO n=2 Tax=Terriglobus roseus TaxID=392734 RepID=A0A1G7KWS8_9BACT|nr:multidrug resistance protein MdtO [Terriglobus roseus]
MSRFERIFSTIRSELQSYPGRMSGSLQDTLCMVTALVLADTLRVPGIGLALALILLLQRESPGITLLHTVQMFGGAATASLACFVWVQVTDGTEVFRFIGFLLLVFFAGFCMTATRVPLFFTIFGFYGFVALSAWDTHHSANAIVTATLYNLASLALALGTASAVNFLLRTRHPADALAEELRKRIRLLANFHREQAVMPRKAGMSALHHQLVQYSHAGDLKLNELYEEVRSRFPRRMPPGVHFRIGVLARAMEQSILAGFDSDANAADAHLRIAEQCDFILDQNLKRPAPPSEDAPERLRGIFTELNLYCSVAQEGVTIRHDAPAPARSFRFFHSDAFTSPDAALYALKLTLSASICYVIYNAVAWPGILTCVVTVLFTGLTSTGAMKQKQLYRLFGAAIGGALAILVESLLFPNMDSVTSLVLVTGSVCLLSAWVSRSPRIGYTGVQIAFAFFITDLAGFGAASQIAPARDRVIGIALGILVMWFVFDQIWPVRTSHALEAIRNRVVHNANAMTTSAKASKMAAMRAEVSADLATMQTLLQSAWFDFGKGYREELVRSSRLGRETEAAAARFYSNMQEAVESHPG